LFATSYDDRCKEQVAFVDQPGSKGGRKTSTRRCARNVGWLL
jgi:hypothetical protein